VQVVMFAWGNPSRGDDAVGPWFAQRFRHRVGSSFQLVEDFQLQVEHLLDCREGELLLFVDACCNGVTSHSFGELTPCPELGHTSHALTPAELLGQYSKLFAAPAPASFLLQVPGRQFELGEPMSAATRTCCETAAKLVERLLDAPQRDMWRTLCTPAERPARRKISARSAPVQPSAAP
jgi:hydrogenase maturation protease